MPTSHRQLDQAVLTVKPLSKRKSLPWQILSIRFQRTKLRVALPIVHRYTRNGILTPDFSLSALQISISHSLQARCRTHGSVARTTQQETIMISNAFIEFKRICELKNHNYVNVVRVCVWCNPRFLRVPCWLNIFIIPFFSICSWKQRMNILKGWHRQEGMRSAERKRQGCPLFTFQRSP